MSSPKPFLVWMRDDRVHLATNEMDVVLEIVEQVARWVPIEVLDELRVASSRLEDLRTFGSTDAQLADAARALDSARGQVPGFSIDAATLTVSEASELANTLYRSIYLVEAMQL